MLFLLLLINTFALAGAISLWLSLSFIAVDVYRDSNTSASVVSLPRMASALARLIYVWFIVLAFVYLFFGDNVVPFFLYLVFFGGLYFYIKKMYADLLTVVSLIKKSGDSAGSGVTGVSKDFSLDINKAIAKIDRTKRSAKGKVIVSKRFRAFRVFFWTLDVLVSLGAVVNFFANDASGLPVLGAIGVAVLVVVMLQVILFIPIYLIVKRIVFATVETS